MRFTASYLEIPARATVFGVRVGYQLPPEMASRLLAALPGATPLVDQASMRDFARSSPATVVVADTGGSNAPGVETLIHLRRDFPSVEVVAYTRLSPEAIPQIIKLAEHGVSDVVIFSHDDTAPRFREFAERAAASPLTTRVLELLKSEIDALPDALHHSIALLYRMPMRFRTIDDLASAAHVTRSTLYRHLSGAGLGAPRRLVASGRVLRAIMLLQDPGRTLRGVATRLGFSKPEQLSHHIRAVSGVQPRQLRRSHDTEDIARVIADRLRASG